MSARQKGSWSNARGEGEAIRWLIEHISYARDECLIWPFSRNAETGYGHLGHEGKQFYAHRKMCELVKGPAPSKKHQAAHSCGNGHEGCVHPMHLSWKTVSGNLLDRREHGTVRYNTNGHVGLLTEEQVAEIRALKGVKTQTEIAAMFGVRRPAIQYWHRHDRPHSKPGTSETSIYRRRRKAARLAATESADKRGSLS